MAFHQTFHSVTNVYNVEGTLILTADSKPDDLARRIAEIEASIRAEPALDPAARDAAVAELKAAETASKAAAPSGSTIQAHLQRAAKMLEGAVDVAGSVGKLATTLFAIGSWAATVLA